MSFPSAERVKSLIWRNGRAEQEDRAVPAEMPIAFTYDGSAHAVMMASPSDLEDFAFGFSLNERIIDARSGIAALEIIAHESGAELRIVLGEAERGNLARRRRRQAGPVGCGLCGIERLDDAMPNLPLVTSSLQITPGEIIAGMRGLAPLQKLNAETHAVHAAAFYVRGSGVIMLREDVGRHNALDKLAGALAGNGIDSTQGVILMTSRLSVELVQKAAIMGVPILAAISAPTALAIVQAERAGVSIAGIVREDGLEIFTHAHRLVPELNIHAP